MNDLNTSIGFGQYIVKNDKMEEKYNKWQDRFTHIREHRLTKIDDMLIDLDLYMEKRDYKTCVVNIAKIEIEIYKARESADALLEEIKEDENQENKNLVWIGEPANLASRLTDVANKEFKDVKYTITGEFYHYDPLGLSASLFFTPQTGWIKETKKMTPEEVANSLSFSQDGKLTFSGRNMSAFKKEEIVYKYKPILLSEEVYTNYKNEHSQRVDIQKKMWIKESRKIKDISYNVWGADLHWSIS